jgi:hypothetical protein
LYNKFENVRFLSFHDLNPHTVRHVLLASHNLNSVRMKEGNNISQRNDNQWRIEGGGVWEFKPPTPEITNALQNRAKLNPIVRTVKNC